jgi:tRNA 5-methylaminomethyl-2-thiouridine biosynthesis bifunctional protein
MNIPGHLLNEHYDDRYFDVVDAIDEARQIYIGNSSIVARLKSMPAGGRRMAIGETGFGAGRLVVALMEALEDGGIGGAVIDYCSVELHPISVDRMERILEDFRGRAADRHIRKVIDAYSRIDTSAPGWHHAGITGDFGTIDLRLYIGEALDMVASLTEPREAWFLDGHGPKKNPDMWRAELMWAIGGATKGGGTVTTFTVAGQVRRNLEAAGFRVEKVPGRGVKKEALYGIM